MLNGACKYRERRDTKGAPKRSGVRADRQAEREMWGGKGAMYAVGSSCAEPEGIARAVYPPGKEGPERGRR